MKNSPHKTSPDILESVLNAPVYDLAVVTPLEFAPKLSKKVNNLVYFKREDMQPVFSFKIRGAYTKMARLTAQALSRGVVAASAGNHAQGVAMSAKHLKCRAVIVMPFTTPSIKVQAVKAWGADVVLFGAVFDETAKYAIELAEKEEMTFIHPYDDEDVIAGQGTVAMEILNQCRSNIDAIFVAIGGGGLISGIAGYVKRLRPEIKIIGVEPIEAASMYQAIKQKKRIILPRVGIFADGVAVRQAGKITYEYCKKYVDEILTVNTDEICAAIKDTFEDNRSILEPAGAVALAGLKAYINKNKITGQKLIAIASGANTDFDRMRFIAERANTGEKREAIFAVTIPEKPGSYLKFCQLLGNRSITEFNYRMSAQNEAHIFVGIGLKTPEDLDKLNSQFKKAGLPIVNLTDDELAKTHLRHMIGGHSPIADNEVLYRFEFPEAPGALMHFLENLSGRWNISLFHYRNLGGDTAQVLVGLQVPANENKSFEEFLKSVGYPYHNENKNPAYRLFIKGG